MTSDYSRTIGASWNAGAGSAVWRALTTVYNPVGKMFSLVNKHLLSRFPGAKKVDEMVTKGSETLVHPFTGVVAEKSTALLVGNAVDRSVQHLTDRTAETVQESLTEEVRKIREVKIPICHEQEKQEDQEKISRLSQTLSEIEARQRTLTEKIRDATSLLKDKERLCTEASEKEEKCREKNTSAMAKEGYWLSSWRSGPSSESRKETLQAKQSYEEAKAKLETLRIAAEECSRDKYNVERELHRLDPEKHTSPQAGCYSGSVVRRAGQRVSDTLSPAASILVCRKSRQLEWAAIGLEQAVRRELPKLVIGPAFSTVASSDNSKTLQVRVSRKISPSIRTHVIDKQAAKRLRDVGKLVLNCTLNYYFWSYVMDICSPVVGETMPRATLAVSALALAALGLYQAYNKYTEEISRERTSIEASLLHVYTAALDNFLLPEGMEGAGAPLAEILNHETREAIKKWGGDQALREIEASVESLQQSEKITRIKALLAQPDPDYKAILNELCPNKQLLSHLTPHLLTLVSSRFAAAPLQPD